MSEPSKGPSVASPPVDADDRRCANDDHQRANEIAWKYGVPSAGLAQAIEEALGRARVEASASRSRVAPRELARAKTGPTCPHPLDRRKEIDGGGFHLAGWCRDCGALDSGGGWSTPAGCAAASSVPAQLVSEPNLEPGSRKNNVQEEARAFVSEWLRVLRSTDDEDLTDFGDEATTLEEACAHITMLLEQGAEPLPTFEEAWKRKEASGYQYGRDALENVRFGWEIRDAYGSRRSRPKREQVRAPWNPYESYEWNLTAGHRRDTCPHPEDKLDRGVEPPYCHGCADLVPNWPAAVPTGGAGS